MEFLLVLLAIFLLSFLIVGIICAFKESSVTTPYKEHGVYSRKSAYLAMDLTGVGALSTVATFIFLIYSFFDKEYRSLIVVEVIWLIISVILFFIGISIYKKALKRCPAHLKDKCIKSMLITGMGVATKLGVSFFTKSVWAYSVVANQSGGFSENYVRSSDKESFYVVSNNGDYVVLQSSYGNETVSAYSNGGDSDGRIWDSAGNVYYPDN